jgi:hypothetical protein
MKARSKRARPWITAALGVGVTLLSLAAAPAVRSGTDADAFEWSGRLARGKTIEIKTVNGEIRAEAWDGDRVEVRATKHWRRSDPDEVTVEVIEHEGGVTICTVYPGRGNRCGVGNEGSMSVRRNDVSVDYVVRVPQGVAFTGRAVNGGVEALGLSGNVLAVSVNGSIEVSTSGAAEASTVNGSIRATMGASRWDDEIRFRTVNGRIDLTLPGDAGAVVSASTVNGDIATDLPLKVKGSFGPKRVSGTIGDGGGGGRLSLETVNGGIRLRTSS